MKCSETLHCSAASVSKMIMLFFRYLMRM